MNKISPYRLIVGLAIVLIGVSLLLDSFGLSIFGEVIRKCWPLIIILLGVVMLGSRKSGYLWPVFVIGAGVVLQLNSLNIVEASVWSLIWPVALIVLGLSVILKNSGSKSKNMLDVQVGTSSEKIDNVTAVLGGSEQNNHSDNFEFAKITSVMGGATYDLRKATIKKEATIEAFSFCGGIELRVPESVEVKCVTTNILGGIEDKTIKPSAKGAPVLNIVGDVIMAGIEIRN